MNRGRWAAGLCFLWLAVAGEAPALSMDSGMITQVQGGVTLTGEKESARPAPAFVKIRMGDRLDLAKEARVQLIYFESGRQETWKGAGQVEVGASAGSSATLQPEVKQLPQMLVRQLLKTPSADVKSRAGMILLRSMPSPDKEREIEEGYVRLRAESETEDITPELYYLAGYFELRDFDKVKQKLTEISERQPDSPAVRAAVQHYIKMMEFAKSRTAK